MATRIAKGFSLCTAIVGLLCLMTGIGIAICAWVLNANLPTGFHYTSPTEGTSGTIAIGNYWWGGMIYILPGILGILAGCTRSVTAMVLYLIFNLICCICSLVVVVLCALVLLVWVSIDTLLQSGICTSVPGMNSCHCITRDGSVINLYGGNCQVFMSIQAIIGAMVSMAALSSLLSFIASYVSCCSLCNQESTDMGNIIISGGAGVYQPPPVVVSSTISHPPNRMGGAYPPPPYAPQSGYKAPFGPQGGVYNGPGAMDAFPTPYSTSDRANLVNSEYR